MLESLLHQKSVTDFFLRTSTLSSSHTKKEVPRKKRNLSNVQYISVVKRQQALSAWVTSMLPRTGFSLLCRAIAHRLCLDMLRSHFRRAGELPPHCVFSADARCWCWGVPVLLQLWVSVATCNLLLAWRAELGGLWQSLSVLMLGWCWGKLGGWWWWGLQTPPIAGYSVLSQGAVDWYHSCFVYCQLGLRVLGNTCPWKP